MKNMRETKSVYLYSQAFSSFFLQSKLQTGIKEGLWSGLADPHLVKVSA